MTIDKCSLSFRLLEPAVHGMGAPTGILEERESISDPKILAQCPDLGRGVRSVEPLGSTPRGRFPKNVCTELVQGCPTLYNVRHI